MKTNEILFTEEQIRERVKEVGKQISADYGKDPILMVGILKGSVPFMADLMRATVGKIEIDFMAVSSYGAGTKSSGVVRIIKDLDHDIEGKNVIIVEDIIDTGLTLQYLKEYLLKRNPASLKIATCLDKPSRRVVDIKPDYCCFEVEDKFIVGYGLDADQQFRQLPYITWIKE